MRRSWRDNDGGESSLYSPGRSAGSLLSPHHARNNILMKERPDRAKCPRRVALPNCSFLRPSTSGGFHPSLSRARESVQYARRLRSRSPTTSYQPSPPFCPAAAANRAAGSAKRLTKRRPPRGQPTRGCRAEFRAFGCCAIAPVGEVIVRVSRRAPDLRYHEPWL